MLPPKNYTPTMHKSTTASWLTVACLLGVGTAVCPFMDADADPAALRARQDPAAPPPPPPAAVGSGPGAAPAATDNLAFMNQFAVDDTGSILTSDVGGQIEDQASLKAGARGPTLLEDFVLRQKITHFDHERVSPDETPTELCGCSVLTIGRFPSELCTLVVRAHSARLFRMATGATSRRLRSWVKPARRRPCLYVSLPSPDPRGVPTWQETSMDLLFDCKSTMSLGFL